MFKRLLERITDTPAGGYFALALFVVLAGAGLWLYWTVMDDVPIWVYKIAVLCFAFYVLGVHVGRKGE